MPALDAAALASLLRWLMAALVPAGAVWLVNSWVKRRFSQPRPGRS